MIERFYDQRGKNQTIINREEKKVWLHLMQRLKVEDSFVHKDGCRLYFSWDNKRRFRHVPYAQYLPLGDHILQRIDRIYTPMKQGETKIKESHSFIMPGFLMSDHAPMLLMVKIHGYQTQPTQHKMNTNHLLDPNLQDQIQDMWAAVEISSIERGEPPSILLNRLRTSKRFQTC